MNRRVLSDVFLICRPSDILHEVLQCLGLDGRTEERTLVGDAFHLALSLYQGKCHGFRSCDTLYHDFTHAAETFLAMARLLHGALLTATSLPPKDIAVGLVAAILHDAGYICKAKEPIGSGARYRSEHEARSMAFISEYGGTLGLDAAAVADCHQMIQGTMMAQNVNTLFFQSESQALLVRLLSAADLLAQLSSATYLERLAHLYDEDQAANESHYSTILDCYRRAIHFDDIARYRIQTHLPQMDTYLVKHFSARWNTPANLYRIAMDRQISFLIKSSAHSTFNPHRDLRRWGSLSAEQRHMRPEAIA